MKNAGIVLGLVLVFAEAVGCGGSSASTADGGGDGTGGSGGSAAGSAGKDGGASACAPFIPGDPVMTWDDNGTSECGTITITDRMTTTSQDFLEIVAATTTGIGVAITVVSYRGPLGGTYTCTTGGSDGGPSPNYVGFTYGTSSTVQDCTITIENPGTPGGAHATGSFSGQVTKHDGESISVTNGAFDTPVMGVGG